MAFAAHATRTRHNKENGGDSTSTCTRPAYFLCLCAYTTPCPFLSFPSKDAGRAKSKREQARRLAFKRDAVEGRCRNQLGPGSAFPIALVDTRAGCPSSTHVRVPAVDFQIMQSQVHFPWLCDCRLSPPSSNPQHRDIQEEGHSKSNGEGQKNLSCIHSLNCLHRSVFVLVLPSCHRLLYSILLLSPISVLQALPSLSSSLS